MQFDDFDKKIQEAAERFHPVYDEQAWSNMESLLNKQMPVNEGGSKKLVWLSLLILSLVVAGVMFVKNQRRSDSKNLSSNVNPAASLIEKQTSIDKKAVIDPVNASPISANSRANAFSDPVIETPFRRRTIHQKALLIERLVKYRTKVERVESISDVITEKDDRFTIDRSGVNRILNTDNNKKPAFENRVLDPTVRMESKDAAAGKNVVARNNRPTLSAAKKAGVMLLRAKNYSPKSESRFANLFSINVSAGLDVSAVDVSKIGRIKLMYGFGLGYELSRKWNLRAGIYKTQKVYNAEASDYHPPEKFWADYPKLEDVEANCAVYELPIIVSYTFRKSSRSGYFGAAGLSSYLMNRETYHYISELNLGQYQSDTKTFRNENKHYLASVRFSAGYERKLGNQISLITEPYLHLPLAGVGFGKVRLKSAGILFTLRLKPFSQQ